MASIIKVDSLQEKTSGNGIVLENSLKDSTGTNEIISPSGGMTIPSGQSIKNSSGTSLIDATGTISSDMVFPAGHILQVKSTTVTDRASSSVSTAKGTTGGDVGLNVTITPLSSTSYFFIQVNVGIATTTAGNTWAIILSRDGVKVGNGEDTGYHYGVLMRGPDHAGNNGTDLNHGVGGSGTYLDTTSGTIGTSITFKAGLIAESGSAYLNRSEGDYNGSDGHPAATYTQSSITVMEIQQ